jgi:hypothetical protein
MDERAEHAKAPIGPAALPLLEQTHAALNAYRAFDVNPFFARRLDLDPPFHGRRSAKGMPSPLSHARRAPIVGKRTRNVFLMVG